MSTTSARETCPGSGRSINAFPGEDVCEVCQQWVRVRQDSTVGKHTRKRQGGDGMSTPDSVGATQHKVTVRAWRAGLHAYGVSCSCGWYEYVQGRKARESARKYAREHRQAAIG